MHIYQRQEGRRSPVPCRARTQALCRHCRQPGKLRRRGLCATCYYTPTIRHCYPDQSKFSRLQHSAEERFYGGLKKPRRPVVARPGTDEKIEELAERVRQRRSLWHPHDGLDAEMEEVER